MSDNNENNNELTPIAKYELDKKYELKAQVQKDKLAMTSLMKIGDSNAAEVAMLAEKYSRGGDLVPKEYQNSPEKCFIAMSKGIALGLDPLTSLQNISVINGRTTIWGDIPLAIVRASGELEFFHEEIREEEEGLVAVCQIKRKGYEMHTATFSQKDAVTASLWGRNVHGKYPKRMLTYRARGFAIRDQFADKLEGIHLREEMEGGESFNQRDITPEKPKTDIFKELEKLDNKAAPIPKVGRSVEQIEANNKKFLKAQDDNDKFMKAQNKTVAALNKRLAEKDSENENLRQKLEGQRELFEEPEPEGGSLEAKEPEEMKTIEEVQHD